VETLIFKVISM